MELTQLRYFLRVYQTRNMCAAAAQLNVSQQAVSKQIQKLEEELGVALFQRSSRGVRATPYADMLAEKVQDFMPGLDALVYDMQHKDRELTGVVRLGVQCWQMGGGRGLSYNALKIFCQAHPRVRLLWENLIPKLCVERLRDRTLDLSVVGMPPDPEGIELFPLRVNHWFC
ncbi:MAG: LysR family transcriptional regulator [Clostridia bacterium]|nr:LysR family transcriptional regulator [Clostridia bacterium]